jgi:hypothetical protein
LDNFKVGIDGLQSNSLSLKVFMLFEGRNPCINILLLGFVL